MGGKKGGKKDEEIESHINNLLILIDGKPNILICSSQSHISNACTS